MRGRHGWRLSVAAAFVLIVSLLAPLQLPAKARAADDDLDWIMNRVQQPPLVTPAAGMAAMPSLKRQLTPADTRAEELFTRGAHQFAPDTIFYPDERARISPAASFTALLLMLDVFDNPLGMCSGVMIGPRMVLTAGHCVYHPDMGGFPYNVIVAPGMDGDQLPYGAYYANWAMVPQGWGNGFDWDWDWGFLTLPEDIGYATGWAELGVLTTASLRASDLNPITIGYPGDKPAGTQWATMQSSLLDVTPTHLLNRLDAYPGQSGSGVFRPSDGRLIGVMHAESHDFNSAVRVHETMVTSLLSGCADVGCSFSYWIEPAAPPPPPSGDAFTRTWQRTDKPVADGAVSRTWMWGPSPATQPFAETYAEGPNGQRLVVYYDKSRMEITNPNGDQNSVWYVTNGLLVKELVTGQLQVGDSQFQPKQAAQINVAGDPGDPNGPTYATFATLLDDPALPSGAAITQRVNRQGIVTNDPSLAGYGVTAAYLVDVPGLRHQVASPFWAFMNAQGTVYENGVLVSDALFENAFYATGYPIAEAYWATVQVGGTPRDVLMQCFERRCLTYTPGNPDGWAVEAGNVGRHYYAWRYGVAP